MTLDELNALPITDVQGVGWREETDPHDYYDATGVNWEVFRVKGVLHRRRTGIMPDTWKRVDGAMRVASNLIHQNIPKNVGWLQIEFEGSFPDALDLTRNRGLSPTYVNPTTEAMWQSFKVGRARLGSAERHAVRLTADLRNAYLDLDERTDSDNKAVMHHLHAIQAILGMRVARRANPDVWSQPPL